MSSMSATEKASTTLGSLFLMPGVCFYIWVGGGGGGGGGPERGGREWVGGRLMGVWLCGSVGSVGRSIGGIITSEVETGVGGL
jgi:hypothetical protein